MTIYIVKWLDTNVQKINHYACASYAAATKKANELNSQQGILVFDKNGDRVEKVQPKTQTDVINVINAL